MSVATRLTALSRTNLHIQRRSPCPGCCCCYGIPPRAGCPRRRGAQVPYRHKTSLERERTIRTLRTSCSPHRSLKERQEVGNGPQSDSRSCSPQRSKCGLKNGTSVSPSRTSLDSRHLKYKTEGKVPSLPRGSCGRPCESPRSRKMMLS